MGIRILEKTEINNNMLNQIADIHREAYSNEHFTSSFSIKKLVEYNSALISASDITIVAEEDGIIGFIIAGENIAAGVRQFTEKNRIWILGRLLQKPIHFFSKISIMIQTRLNPPKPSQAQFRLLSIATRPDTQSKGIGADMIDFLEKELLKLKINIYGLSVKSSNNRAINFYECNGFIREKVFTGSSFFIKRIQKK